MGDLVIGQKGRSPGRAHVPATQADHLPHSGSMMNIRRTGGATTSIPAALAWSAAGIAVIAVTPVGSPETAALRLSALAALWGIAVFWSSGGQFITAASIFGFAVAFFVGFAGFLTTHMNPGAHLLPVLSMSYFASIWASTLFLRRPAPSVARDADSSDDAASSDVLRPILLASAALAGLALLAQTTMSAALFFSSVTLSVCALASARRIVSAVAVGSLGFVAYYILMFDGFGRLTLGALGLAFGAALAPLFRRRWIKAAILLGLVPVITLMAYSRVAIVNELNPYGDNTNAGLGSVASPMSTGAKAIAIAQAGLVESSPGHTYLASLLSPIPRELWPEKPIGWGAELTRYTKPELAGTAHSEAATGFVEPYWNYGLIGVMALVPLLGLAIRGIDILLARSYRRPLSINVLLLRTFAVLLASGIPDFVWGGSFAFTVRGGFRSIAILPLLVAVALATRRQGHREPTGAHLLAQPSGDTVRAPAPSRRLGVGRGSRRQLSASG